MIFAVGLHFISLSVSLLLKIFVTKVVANYIQTHCPQTMNQCGWKIIVFLLLLLYSLILINKMKKLYFINKNKLKKSIMTLVECYYFRNQPLADVQNLVFYGYL